MRHLLLEVYCDVPNERSIPDYCVYGPGNLGPHCFEENCNYLSYTLCPNELAYVGTTGLVKEAAHCAGFGGSMCPENMDEETESVLIKKWEELCVKKIEEAVQEFHKKYVR